MKKSMIGFFAALLFLSGCSQNTDSEEKIDIYYINKQGNGIKSEQLDIEDGNTEKTVAAITKDLQDTKQFSDGGSSVLANDLKIESYQIEGNTINVNLSGDYGSLSNETKLLVAAGIVKTYTQIDEIDYVNLMIQGKALQDSAGNEFGTLSADDFVIHSGSEINAYSKVEMTLYFTDLSGEFVQEQRTVYCSSAVPIEQSVLEELIKGPNSTGYRAILPSEINFINVTTQKDICYVNFEEGATELMQNYDVEKSLKAIAKSLSAASGIKKVQFSVGGSTDVEMNGVSLDQIFEP